MVDLSNFKNIKSGGGEILKPEADKPYKIRIIGEPWVYNSEYQGNVSTRFAISIYNQTDNRAQILMLSRTAFGDIYDITENEEWGSYEDYDITMKRTGEGTDTKYSFVPSAKKPLEDGKKEEVEAIVLDEVLSRLPSVQQAFPLSAVNDTDMLFPKKRVAKKEVNTEGVDPEPEMPEGWLQ